MADSVPFWPPRLRYASRAPQRMYSDPDARLPWRSLSVVTATDCLRNESQAAESRASLRSASPRGKVDGAEGGGAEPVVDRWAAALRLISAPNRSADASGHVPAASPTSMLSRVRYELSACELVACCASVTVTTLEPRAVAATASDSIAHTCCAVRFRDCGSACSRRNRGWPWRSVSQSRGIAAGGGGSCCCCCCCCCCGCAAWTATFSAEIAMVTV
jgi:hypothetical protein